MTKANDYAWKASPLLLASCAFKTSKGKSMRGLEMKGKGAGKRKHTLVLGAALASPVLRILLFNKAAIFASCIA